MLNQTKYVRTSGGVIWRDRTLEEWPTNDCRLFVGDLGQHVTDQALTEVLRRCKCCVCLSVWVSVCLSVCLFMRECVRERAWVSVGVCVCAFAVSKTNAWGVSWGTAKVEGLQHG